jgi:replicative DNA helicase
VSSEHDPLLRVPPHDVEAGMSVLGSGFIDPESVELAREIIDEGDFYREAHRLIWRSQCDLTDGKQPIDAVTVLAQLNGHAEQIGGAAYVAELAAFVPTARNVRAYAKIVREKSILRKLSMFGTELAAAACEARNPEELVAAAEFEVATIASGMIQKPEPSKASMLAQALWRIEHGQEDSSVVPTGFAPIDQSFGGFTIGHVTVLGARTSRGKTALATNVAINAARLGFPTLLVSLEMTAEEMWLRAIGCEAEVDLFLARRRGFRDGECERVDSAGKHLEEWPLEILYRPGMRPRDLRIECRRLSRRTPLKLVIVDYLGLMRGDRREKDRWREMGEIVLALKSMAGELGVPILVLAQLNREANEETPPR